MWHLVSDSSCDLYELEGTEGKMDFATIPFSIRIGGKEFIDDENMNVGEMLEANETHSEMAQTACPSPEAWREKFSAPGPVIAFTISGALSGCYNSALIGRNMVLEDGKFYPVICASPGDPEEAYAAAAAAGIPLGIAERFGPVLTFRRHPAVLRCMERELEKDRKLLSQLREKENRQELSVSGMERIAELENEIRDLKTALDI